MRVNAEGDFLGRHGIATPLRGSPRLIVANDPAYRLVANTARRTLDFVVFAELFSVATEATLTAADVEGALVKLAVGRLFPTRIAV